MLKRSSGGQTVILTPQTVVISVRLISHRLENPQVYFKQINSLIINTLKNIGIKNLDQKGISDITIGEKKILGSSIYRKKSMVFYHAVLNIAEPISSISRYLKHPTREPDYRAGRSHEEFVTSIREAGYPFTPEQVRQALSETFSL
jgi:lipoate-protein ligase A